MQGDGNLVVDGAGAAVWASGTSENPGAYLVLTDAGQLEVLSPAGVVLWGPGVLASGGLLAAGQSLLSGNGAYRLTMQGDGNLVEYGGPSAVWATGTNPAGSYAVLQGDGNLVVYAAGGAALWASGTSGNPGAYLVLAANGQLEIVSPAGAVLWSNGVGADFSVGYQINVAHSGVQSDSSLTPPLIRRWLKTFSQPASYPLIADGKVFVTVSSASASGGTLYALDQADGHVLWSQPIAGTYSFSASAYDAGQVFVVNFDGLLRAFDGTTGAFDWSTQLGTQWVFTSPPVAAKGVVYAGGAGDGGTVYAVDESTGQILATSSVENGDHSSPALSDAGVFVSYACDQAYGFAKTTLAFLWHHSTGCEGGGGKTTVYADGFLFTRDSEGDLILDAGTGQVVANYNATVAPAVDGRLAVRIDDGAGDADPHGIQCHGRFGTLDVHRRRADRLGADRPLDPSRRVRRRRVEHGAALRAERDHGRGRVEHERRRPDCLARRTERGHPHGPRGGTGPARRPRR